MPLATIIIPIAPYHMDCANDAVTSAEAQTVPVEIIPLVDVDSRGAGWARNRGVSRSDSPFIVFLDADDLLDPQFVERTVATYRKGVFVYTDWVNADGRRATLPNCTDETGWQDERVFHLITTLMPTAFHYYIGGFNEALPGHEDLDYYLRLHQAGVCGIRHPETLVTYRSRLGRRSASVRKSGILDTIRGKYGRMNKMGCCGNGTPNSAAMGANQAQPGDVLAITLWQGNRTLIGRVTGRKYYGGNGKRISMDLRDAQAQPDKFKQVVSVQDISPDVDGLLDILK